MLFGKSPIEIKAKKWVTDAGAPSTGHLKYLCVKYISKIQHSFQSLLAANGCYMDSCEIQWKETYYKNNFTVTM